MLGDEELELLDESLKSVWDRSQQENPDFRQLILQFRLLLESYHHLKRKYQEERGANQGGEHPIPTSDSTSSSLIPPGPQICRFYQKGTCRYGDKCSNIHTLAYDRFSGYSRYNTSPSTSTYSKTSWRIVRDEAYYATKLPLPNPQASKSIPVNKDGERIDIYLPRPAEKEWEAYTRHARQHKPCNRYYLTGKCDNENCYYEHSELDFNPVDSILYLIRRRKCKQGPRCRLINCQFGHHCQKGGCTGGKRCLFNRYLHTIDLTVDRWEPPHGHASLTEGVWTASEEWPMSQESPASEEWPMSQESPAGEESQDATSTKSVEVSLNVSLLDLNF
ncbi:zinc finger CCCH domain-containing protein [Aspergillus undulatus]|uniref:zinc finger CCCH domain-containing protein n=1 Tax=Aspergillus undulatus TaxID=1810928 RepID=UPI003CCDCFD3